MMRTSLIQAIEIVVQSCAWLVLFSLFSRQDSDVRDTVKRREEEPRFFEVWQNRFLKRQFTVCLQIGLGCDNLTSE